MLTAVVRGTSIVGIANGADFPALHADGGSASDSKTRSRNDRLWTHVSPTDPHPFEQQAKKAEDRLLTWLLNIVFGGVQGLPS